MTIQYPKEVHDQQAKVNRELKNWLRCELIISLLAGKCLILTPAIHLHLVVQVTLMPRHCLASPR